MSLLAVISHKLSVFTVRWLNATQLYQIRADLKHSQIPGCEKDAPLRELQSKMVIG